jgi:hypothetical protein
MMVMFNGMRVFVSEYAEARRKVPRRPHRKKRIAKKWLKSYGYKYVGAPGVIVMDQGGEKIIFCTQEVFDALRRKAESSRTIMESEDSGSSGVLPFFLTPPELYIPKPKFQKYSYREPMLIHPYSIFADVIC